MPSLSQLIIAIVQECAKLSLRIVFDLFLVSLVSIGLVFSPGKLPALGIWTLAVASAANWCVVNLVVS